MKYGEVWDVDFAPAVGQEIARIRPAIIVSSNAVGRLQLKIVVPVTDPGTTIQPWHVELQPDQSNGLAKRSVADCFQIKSISQARFVRLRGVLNTNDLDDVKVTLATILEIV